MNILNTLSITILGQLEQQLLRKVRHVERKNRKGKEKGTGLRR
jgi:hypothetical protein